MRIRWIVGGLGVVAAVGGGWLAWHALPYLPPAHEVAQPASVTREIAYVERYRQRPNAAYGTLGGTDCVNFTSQALHARGWAMTAAWGSSTTLGRRAATRTWVSSTAMMRWLAGRPDLAVQLGDDRRDEVPVGDVVQFDWDASGDRDHTAVVTRVGGRRIEVAQHSPAALHADVDALIAEHGGRGTIHYWNLWR